MSAPQDTAWRHQAACRAAEPDRLFVEGAAQRAATAICRGCTVQLQCLAHALDRAEEYGVWGGLTERQRRSLLRARPEVRCWRTHLLRVAATRSR